MKLTTNEIEALKICLNYDDRENQLSDNYSNGGPQEFADALFNGNLQAAGGLITSLQEKGLGYVEVEEAIHEGIFWLTEKGVNTIFDIIENEQPTGDADMNTETQKPVYLVNTDKMAVVGRFATMDDLMVVADAAKYNYTEFDSVEDLEGGHFKFADMMALYNNLAETPVKKFRDKATGAARVWALVEEHDFAPIKPRAKAGADAILVEAEAEKKAYRDNTKVGILINALKEGGKTLEELAELVGWQPATVTAYFYYDVKRKGYGVERKDNKFYIVE